MPKYQDWLVPEKLTLLQGWARDGLTDEAIAHNIGISMSTYYSWKKKHLEFSEAIKKGKEVTDYEVESALLRRALGCKVTEKITEISGDKKHIRITEKEIPPDPTAGIFWLKNRRRMQWGAEEQARIDSLKSKVELDQAKIEVM